METHKLKQINDLILPILESRGVDLIDFELKGKSGFQVIRIFVDVEGGVTLGQCEELSREISDQLDRKDLIPGRYRLEVSSPGLDRPLKTLQDYKRNLNRTVKIVLKDYSKDEYLSGTIERISDNIIIIKQNGELIEIDIDNVSVAKILPIW